MSNTRIEWRSALEGRWLDMIPVRVGGVSSNESTPDQQVLLIDGNRPRLRVEAYTSFGETFAFRDAIMWCDSLVIGWGNSVYLIDVDAKTVTTHLLGAYYGHMHPADDYLLIASAERVLRIEPDQTVLWRSELLGIDGVVVHQVESEIIHGAGEWDPPGGWKEFQIHLNTGQLT